MTSNSKSELSVFLLAASVTLGGCSSDDPVTSSTAVSGGDVDISYAIFSERDADCATYDNTYSSSVTDETLGLGFEGAVMISSDTNNCTISANSIPNHDFNDSSASFANPVAEVSTSFQVARAPAVAGVSTALTQSTYNGVMLRGGIRHFVGGLLQA